MLACPKCKSDAMYWQNDRIFDPETQELIKGYWKCIICCKIMFEPPKPEYMSSNLHEKE